MRPRFGLSGPQIPNQWLRARVDKIVATSPRVRRNRQIALMKRLVPISPACGQTTTPGLIRLTGGPTFRVPTREHEPMTILGQTMRRDLPKYRDLAMRTEPTTLTAQVMTTTAGADKTLRRVHLRKAYAVTTTHGRNHLVRIAPTSLAQCRGPAVAKRSPDGRSNPTGPLPDLISRLVRKPATTSLNLILW
jgi:hypothetical protein